MRYFVLPKGMKTETDFIAGDFSTFFPLIGRILAAAMRVAWRLPAAGAQDRHFFPKGKTAFHKEWVGRDSNPQPTP